MMKRTVFLALVIMTAWCMQAREYPKVIVPGDYPDPTILRDGEDFYMTHSPIVYYPGFLIWHSRDLVNWEPVTRAKAEWKGAAWAPDLLKYNGKYYIYFPADKTIYVMWADNIAGPWSDPIDMHIHGIDPGHIVGKDGKRYLYLSGGKVVPLSDDGLSVTGTVEKVYDGWEYPEDWETECKCLESPKLIFKDGYYYLISAEGGTAGPATSHMIVAARSESPLGPWKNSPYNPVVHTYSADEDWWSKGHGTLIDDANGQWWMVYHAYANSFHTLGRYTLLEPVEWTADGWFRTVDESVRPAPVQTATSGMPLSDDFYGTQLGLQWTFWKEYAPDALQLKDDALYMEAKGSTPADARKLLVTATDKSYTVEADVTVTSGNAAGLVLFYNEQAFAGITSDGKTFTIYSNAQQQEQMPNAWGEHVYLRIVNQENICRMMASADGKEWITLAEDVDVSAMHHNNYKNFYALRPALVSMQEGTACFKRFAYRHND